MRHFVVAGALAALAAAGLAQPAQAKDPVIIMVSGPLIEPFFGPLKKGADDAAKALGIEYQYSTIQDFNNVQADLTRLVGTGATDMGSLFKAMAISAPHITHLPGFRP